jgi:hypothetical protein
LLGAVVQGPPYVVGAVVVGAVVAGAAVGPGVDPAGGSGSAGQRS